MGGTPLMWRAGHSLIKAKMRETGAVLAGELSGHICFADRYYGYDDAIYAGARLLEILTKRDGKLSEQLQDLPATASTPEIRVPCPDDRKFRVVDRMVEAFRKGGGGPGRSLHYAAGDRAAIRSPRPRGTGPNSRGGGKTAQFLGVSGFESH